MHHFNKNSIKEWILFCSIGEFIGIAVAAGIAVAHFRLAGEPDSVLEKVIAMIIMLLAGVIEGSLVALFQWRVLKKYLLTLSLRNWGRVTIAAALTGWFLGMIPSLFFNSTANNTSASVEPPLILILLLAASSGVIFGAIFGWFQWLELRKHVFKSTQWILANAWGWGLGIVWVYVAATLPSEHTPIMFTLSLGALSGMLMGLTVGIFTSLYLPKLINSSHPKQMSSRQ